MRLSGEEVRNLHKYELKVLQIIERHMQRYDWVPREIITRSSGYSDGEVAYRLGQLLEKGFIKFEAVPYEGYALVFAGYDVIALRSLASKDIVTSLGPFIGEGKESVVYEAMGLGPLAIKLHRIGQRAFRQVRIKREYLPREGHCPWLLASHYSAQREYDALKKLVSTVNVPVPIGINRHAVVMSYLEGSPLNRVTVSDPQEVLTLILEEIRKSCQLGVIHGDLSEYNVIVDEDRVYLIDWPQWVETRHQNAPAFLEHDIRTILGFFKKKYRMDVPYDEAMERVLQ